MREEAMKWLRWLVVLAAAIASASAFAQAYPARAVRLIVPFPAGGPADIFARALAQGMAEHFAQPVVIENRAGAGGVVGVDAVAKAAPDGYMLGLNSASAVSIAPFAMSAIPYNPQKDLALITTVVRVPEVLAVHPAVPAGTLAEFIAYARANPGKINFGSSGSGSITHLAGELLKAEARVDMVHVPYKGAAPAVSDLIGGQVQMAIFDVPVLLPHIRSGKLKALAITSANRAASLPEVPTTAEGNYPRVTSDNWYGLVAPAATAPEVLRRIGIAALAALRAPALIDQFARLGATTAPSTPGEYASFLAAEQAKWSKVVEAIGFRE